MVNHLSWDCNNGDNGIEDFYQGDNGIEDDMRWMKYGMEKEGDMMEGWCGSGVMEG